MTAQGLRSEPGRIYIGRTGWSLSRAEQDQFPVGPNHLARYAGRFRAVEISSSFYRPHRDSTYRRWAATVPSDFRFSIKMPRAITHERRLIDVAALLDEFLDQVNELGGRLGCLLVQLPPSLAFDAQAVGAFFEMMRTRFQGTVAVEPRHPSWFATDVDPLLDAMRVARVAADPACAAAAAVPGGWTGFIYRRLHGSPVMYRSAYSEEFLSSLASRLVAESRAGTDAWCVLDNTAEGAATVNALSLARQVGATPPKPQMV